MSAVDAAHIGKLAHAAALGGASWKPLLEAVGAMCGAQGVSLFTPGLDPDRRRLAQVQGSFSDLAGYQAFWAARDPWLLAVKGTRVFDKAGETRFSAEFLADAAVKRTAYYNEYARFTGSGHKLALKVCDSRDAVAPITHLVVGRTFADAPFTDEDKKRMTAIWPSVHNAIRNRWGFATRVSADQAAAVALDALPMAVLVLREDCRIEFANARAVAFLRDGRTVKQSNGTLTAVGGLGASDLQVIVGRSKGDAERIDTSSLAGATVRRLAVSAASMRDIPFYATAWPAGSVLLILSDAAATAGKDERWLDTIGRHFQLTPTERHVLGQLWEGKTVDRIAQERGVIAATVRTHLAALFDKTGRRRQSELMRLASGL